MKTVTIGDRVIGEGHPCFVILELGVNFKDMAEARELIDKGIEIGADAIKFQTFHAKTMAMKGAILYDGRGLVDQYEECLDSEEKQSDGFQTELIRYAQKKGVITFSTPSHPSDIELLKRIGGVQAFKFGSDDLTNLPLLRYAAREGVPLFISSGVSTLAQVDEAIRAIRAEGNEDILLFHCVSQYPANASDMNLRTMQTLQRAFDVPVGLSDHTEGTAVSIAAATLGAHLIEKHFTMDKTKEGPDNFFSMEPAPMKQIIDGVHEVEAALGVPYKTIRKAEESMIVNFHKSVYALEDIAAGALVTDKNTDVLRPLQGIEAKYIEVVRGMRPLRLIKKGQPLQWEDFKESKPSTKTAKPATRAKAVR